MKVREMERMEVVTLGKHLGGWAGQLSVQNT